MKQKCTNCGKEKDASEFNKATTTESGLLLWCKACIKEYDQSLHLRYSKHPMAQYRPGIFCRCLKDEREKDK
jgi:hypothetical protein